MKTSIRSHKTRSKFCTCMNRVFGCRDVYMCNIACPLYLWAEAIRLMDEKNLPMGEAFRLSLRLNISKEDGKKIIREAIEGGEKIYPPKNWKDKV